MKAIISYLPSQVYQNFFSIEYALEKVSLGEVVAVKQEVLKLVP